MGEELIRRSNTLGSKPMVEAGVTTSTFCIATVGDVVVKTPNRWVTIFRGGKLQVDDKAQVFRVSSEDDIKGDGVWLVDAENGRTVYVEADGVRMLLASSSDGFLSYTAEQELTPDQITRAVLNVGLYFATLEEAQAKGLNDGLVYVTGTGVLYRVSDGVFTDIIASAVDAELDRRTEEDSTTLRIGGIYIDGNSDVLNADGSLTIQVDGVDYVTLRGGTVYVSRSVVFGSSVTIGEVSTSGAQRGDSGLLVYSGSDGVTLEVDRLVVHNPDEAEDEGPAVFGEYVWSAGMNLIRSAEWLEGPARLKVAYKYDNLFNAGDIVKVCLGGGVNWADVDDTLREGVRYMCVTLDHAPQAVTTLLVGYTVDVGDIDGDGEDETEPRSVEVVVDPMDGWDEEDPDDYNSYGESVIDDEDVDGVVSLAVLDGDGNIRLRAGSSDSDDGSGSSGDALPMVEAMTEAVVEAGSDGVADVLYIEGNTESGQSVLDALAGTPVVRTYNYEERSHGSLHVDMDGMYDGRFRLVASAADEGDERAETELMSADAYDGVLFGAYVRYGDDLEWGDRSYENGIYDNVLVPLSLARRMAQEYAERAVEELREELVERGVL